MREEKIVTFGNVVGHLQQINVLKDMIIRDRFPASILFSGPEGVGKKLVAVEVAKVLTGGCEYNLRVIGEEGSPLIDDLRESISWLCIKPDASVRKVLIVDRAEMMRKEVSNALLKLLEEPPEYAHIILISSAEHVLLPTILSRVFILRFSKLTKRNVEFVLGKMGVVCDDLLLKICMGSPGRALKLVETGVIDIVNEFVNLLKSGKLAEKVTEFSSRFARFSKDDAILFVDSLMAFASSASLLDRLNRTRAYLMSNVRPVSTIEWLILSGFANYERKEAF